MMDHRPGSIVERVLATMQEADEIGGLAHDLPQYVATMTEIACTAAARATAASSPVQAITDTASALLAQVEDASDEHAISSLLFALATLHVARGKAAAAALSAVCAERLTHGTVARGSFAARVLQARVGLSCDACKTDGHTELSQSLTLPGPGPHMICDACMSARADDEKRAHAAADRAVASATGRDYSADPDEGGVLMCSDCGLPAYYDLRSDTYHHAVPCGSCFALEASSEIDLAHPAMIEPHALLVISDEEAVAVRGTKAWSDVLDRAYACAALAKQRCFVTTLRGGYVVAVGPEDRRAQ